MSGRVLLAAPRSFCAGVDRAIEIVERLLEQHGAPVYVRHQIVHNENVVRRLEELGAVFVEDESEIPAGEICVLSAHGVAPSVKENAKERGLRVVDATCPLVNKVHAEARRYADSGHLVALVGHANHVEVIGTLGERPDSTVVIESPEQARALQTDKPIAVITQTTLSLDDVAPIVDALETSQGELRRPHADDICYATQNRQDAVKAMVARGRDVDPRDRLRDELERAAPRRGRAERRRRGDADRRRGAPRRRADRRARDHRPHCGCVDARAARPVGRPRPLGARLSDARGDHGRARARSFQAAEGGRARMTSIEVPYSIAAALPTLSVMDITNDVAQSLSRSERRDGIAYVSATQGLSLVRVQERETGFFEDLECLLERVVPSAASSRERLVHALLGTRTEQIPFSDGRLCLGQWQRIMLFSLDSENRTDWSLTLLG